jgi:hypothetical protein
VFASLVTWYVLSPIHAPHRYLRAHSSAESPSGPPLAFVIERAQHFLSDTRHQTYKPTDGALRAAKEIERNPSFIESTAEVIDRETGVRELVEILENIIAETGDLIESRSPELVAQAHAALRHYGDESRRQEE